jgi:hypothetical protein
MTTRDSQETDSEPLETSQPNDDELGQVKDEAADLPGSTERTDQGHEEGAVEGRDSALAPGSEPIASEESAKKPSGKKKGRKSTDRSGSTNPMGLTPVGFAMRFVGAFLLVFGTFNPSGSSYYHWIAAWEGGDLPAKILLGLLILAGWVVFFRATARSLGPLGALLAAAVCGVVLWWLIDLQVVSQDTDVITYGVLFIVSVVLTLGLTGSFVWRRLTGQYHVDSEAGGMED